MKKQLSRIYVICFIFLFSFPAFGQDIIPGSEDDIEETESGSRQDGTINNTREIDMRAGDEQLKAFGFSAKVGIEPYFGYTLYQIGGKVRLPGDDTIYVTNTNPISELKFPLNVFMATCDLDFTILDKFLVHADIKRNFTKDAGKMEDSDWGYYYAYTGDPDSLDIYSESDSELDAWIVNGDLKIKALKNPYFSLKAGAGFMFQRFDYIISNLDQTYPSIAPDVHDKVPGKVGTYKIDYYIPYAVIAPCFNIKNIISIEHEIALGYVIAKDIDYHLLRYKRCEGDSRGYAFITSVKAECNYFSRVVFSLSMNYMYIDAEGTQKQYQYREYTYYDYDVGGYVTIPVGPIVEIDNKIESKQYSVNISAGISF